MLIFCNKILFSHRCKALTRDLQDRSGIDMSECFIDGTFSLAKKGATCGKDSQRVVKAPGSWQSQALVVLFYL